MKKCILLIFSLILFSCSKFLDIKPYGKTIPRTADEYASLLNYHLNSIDEGEEYIVGNISTVTELACYSDNLERNLATNDESNKKIPLYIGNKINSMQVVYQKRYELIRDCNIIIDNMKDISSKASSDVLGTAYALRAFAYLNLLRDYADTCYANPNGLAVPLVNTFNIEAKIRRATISQITAQIESDFKKAVEQNIQDPIYRFNSDVVTALLARLYFWVADYDKALNYASVILEKYPLLSGEEYKKMIESKAELIGNQLFRSSIYPQSKSNEYSSSVSYAAKCPVSSSFVKLFSEKDQDIRYSMYFDESRHFTKYPFIGIRSAEMLFIKAESLYHLDRKDEALASLNDFRSKRINSYMPYTMESLPKAKKTGRIVRNCKGKELDPLLLAILNERRKELFMEGDRWYELKRNGKPEFWVAQQGRKYITRGFMYTFPIPVNDILLIKGLIQNPGYDKVY